MGTRINHVYEGFRQKTQAWAAAHNATVTIRPYGLRYPAEEVPIHNWTNAFADKVYVANLWDGVYSLEYAMEQETTRCPNQKIVLSGYSSGAFAVHLALANMSSNELSHIGAIALLADPAKRGDGAEFTEGDASPTANGIYTMIKKAAKQLPPAIPPSQVGHTITFCDFGDIVCAPGPGANLSVHGNYTAGETEHLGEWDSERMFK